MERLRSLFSTTAARLSALYLLLFTICAFALVFYMTGEAARFLLSQTKSTILEEVADLAQVYTRAGLPGLVRTIDRRSRAPGAGLYLIADNSGVVLAGNVAQIDNRILGREGWTKEPFDYKRFSEDGNEKMHHAVAQIIALPNGMRILVGQDLGEPERFRQVVQRSLKLALAMMGIGAFLIWFFVGRRALKRIDTMSEASRRIMGGDLAGRLPVTGSGDEFDRLAQNLNQMLAKISELNDGLKQVSDNIAHDLKTPLTRLRNKAEAALNSNGSKAENVASLEEIIAQSDLLIRTFNSILMISRLEAGYSSEQMAELDLNVLTADVVELYEPLAEEAGVKIQYESGTPNRILGNRELLSQSLSNIIDNAIKYSKGHSATPAVEISTNTSAQNVSVTVSDNGPGIPEVDFERVTERFVRLEKSRSEPGSGLGLSLAKAVMKTHRGELKLAGGGIGLRVTLNFPTLAPRS
jgi:signal transduction histidine kinase